MASSVSEELTVLRSIQQSLAELVKVQTKQLALQKEALDVPILFTLSFNTPIQGTPAVIGNLPALGWWKHPLEMVSVRDKWHTTVSLPLYTMFEWKFVILQDGEVVWEPPVEQNRKGIVLPQFNSQEWTWGQ